MLVNRADSHKSTARFVRPHGWQKKLPDEKNAFGVRLETLLAREPRQKTRRYYDTIASKTPQPNKPLPTK
jgi:membrane-bound lytic murein transglycosylase B